MKKALEKTSPRPYSGGATRCPEHQGGVLEAVQGRGMIVKLPARNSLTATHLAVVRLLGPYEDGVFGRASPRPLVGYQSAGYNRRDLRSGRIGLSVR